MWLACRAPAGLEAALLKEAEAEAAKAKAAAEAAAAAALANSGGAGGAAAVVPQGGPGALPPQVMLVYCLYCCCCTACTVGDVPSALLLLRCMRRSCAAEVRMGSSACRCPCDGLAGDADALPCTINVPYAPLMHCLHLSCTACTAVCTACIADCTAGCTALQVERELAAQRARELDRVREDPFAVMLAAREALAANTR